MIQKYIEQLNELRCDHISLKRFNYKKGLDSNGYEYDINANNRFKLLLALQYDRKISDLNIIIYLFKAEIKMHQNAPFQGVHESIRLNAFLLSQYKNPEYIWLFLEAKSANFDTLCGFDYEFILSAGIEKTFHYLINFSKKEKERLSKFIGSTIKESSLSEKELEQWNKRQINNYPDILSFKNIEEEIDLAIDLEEVIIINNKIEEWKKLQTSWNENNLRLLTYYENLLNNNNGEIWAQEKLYEYKNTDWDKSSHLNILIRLYLKYGKIEKAVSKLKEVILILPKINNWKQFGLGRFLIEDAFDIVLFYNPDKYSFEVKNIYHWAIKIAIEMDKNNYSMHWDLLKKAIKSSNNMNDSASKIIMELRWKKEQEKHKNIFGEDD